MKENMSEFNPTAKDYVEHYRDYIQHIQLVMEGMATVQRILMARMLTHDRSKIEPEELDAYAEVVPGFKNFEYGTEAHRAHGAKLGPAWQHHIENNKHHVEHFPNGINGMTLVDLIELVCDWRAANVRDQRHGKTGSGIDKSLDIFAQRFDVDPQILNVIYNTYALLLDYTVPLPATQKYLG